MKNSVSLLSVMTLSGKGSDSLELVVFWVMKAIEKSKAVCRDRQEKTAWRLLPLKQRQ